MRQHIYSAHRIESVGGHMPIAEVRGTVEFDTYAGEMVITIEQMDPLSGERVKHLQSITSHALLAGVPLDMVWEHMRADIQAYVTRIKKVEAG
jgi:hypothetical protein